MFLFTITLSQGQHELWCRMLRQERKKKTTSVPANVPLSKPGETNGLRDRITTSAAVTLSYSVDCIVREEGAIMWERIVRVCLGSWQTGSQTLTALPWHESRASHNVQWQEQVVIVSQSEKYCRLQCHIVLHNRSFRATSSIKLLPAPLSHCPGSSSSVRKLRKEIFNQEYGFIEWLLTKLLRLL